MQFWLDFLRLSNQFTVSRSSQQAQSQIPINFPKISTIPNSNLKNLSFENIQPVKSTQSNNNGGWNPTPSDSNNDWGDSKPSGGGGDWGDSNRGSYGGGEDRPRGRGRGGRGFGGNF
jgi:hypothetical protein